MTPNSSMTERLFWFISTYPEVTVAIVSLVSTQLLMFIRSTRWGKNKKAALDRLTALIEAFDSKRLREFIAEANRRSTPEVRKAIAESAQTADPKKPNPEMPIAVRAMDAIWFTGPSIQPVLTEIGPKEPAK